MTVARVSGELLQAVAELAGPPDASVIAGIRRLSSLFTVLREGLRADYMADPGQRRAYLLYFLPVNLAKVASVLEELGPFPPRPLRVLDLGSGPGVGALAVFEHLRDSRMPIQSGSSVLALDRNRQALHDARSLWASLEKTMTPVSCTLDTAVLDLERPGSTAPWKHQVFDLILIPNLLNELFETARDPVMRRTKWVEQVFDALAPDGSLVLIEPALRDTTRGLHMVRDRLVAQGKATVYSPCLHERPCPALIHPDDWCHEERPWMAPMMVESLDRSVGFIKDALKFSYVILRKDGRTIVDRKQEVHRVVSERLVMNGEQRVWLCNGTGRQLVGRLDKERSETNRSFEHWHRGAIVRIDQIERAGPVGRIRKAAEAKLVKPI
jgi:ribosomal protein RSM22 (predicted rRNA methylase)